ncbi:MAG: NlpC/P60 family protein [Patulibacter sp.]
MSATGLTAKERSAARAKAVRGGLLVIRNAPQIHYTQGAARWSGINAKRRAYKGEYPVYADCSSMGTWLLWDALKKHINDGLGDIVNGAAWRAGYTGTMIAHGKSVSASSLLPGDAIIYGAGGVTKHVAISLGGRKAMSHGSEGGPYLVDYAYRSDILDCRRYIR